MFELNNEEVTQEMLESLAKKQKPDKPVVCKARSTDGEKCSLDAVHNVYKSSHLGHRDDGSLVFFS